MAAAQDQLLQGPLVSFQRSLATPITPPLTPLHESKPEGAADNFFDIPVQQANRARAVVAIIGTGYVGLHLVEAFAQAYDVIAFDVSSKRVKEVEQIVHGKPVTCTSDPRDLSDATHFLIAVSTVVDAQHRIDTSCIEAAIATVRTHARPGSTVVIESSVAVGMTRDLLAPLMQSRAFQCGMSPERVDPGRTSPHYTTIPKLISGIDADSLASVHALYRKVFPNLVPVSCPEVAEMTKLYENCQRMMCIAYANEMADACAQLSIELSSTKTNAVVNIDPWEVSRAAATKPFGYMPYTPSLGVGGHCIPVNPYYLLSNSDFPLLQACTERMRDRPARIGDSLMAKLGTVEDGRARLLVVGLGFKQGQSVLSNSPGLALATHLLSSYDVYVEYADPLVDQAMVPGVPKMDDAACWNIDSLARFDKIVVAVDQPGLDLGIIREAEGCGTAVEWWCNV